MKILVIGNGFDLAHGLATSYSDFLCFVEACDAYCNKKDNNIQNPFSDYCRENEGTPVFDEICGLLTRDNRLLKYFLEIYQERCIEGENGWIDFEKEISVIIQAIDAAREKYRLFGEDYISNLSNDQRDILKRTIADRISVTGQVLSLPNSFKEGRAPKLLDELNGLTRLLEIYLSELIEKKTVKVKLPECIEQDFTHVLNFNYTDTFKRLYDPQGELKYCYIHGKVEKDSNRERCNLVLGIDEFLDSSRRDSDNAFVWFKNFYQRIFKDTGSEYIDWLNQFKVIYSRSMASRERPVNEVFFYGHSLDITDKDVISWLILEPNTETTIYYYSQEDLSEKIANLVNVIGEDELIKRTRGKDRTIQFKKTKDVIEVS